MQIDFKKAYYMIPQGLIINYLEMYKISDKVTKIITEAVKKWKVKLIAGGKTLTEGKIQNGIFQEDALSPLLFVTVMMPLNYILRKSTGGYKFTTLQEKINHLMYMDDIKLFAKNEKELETLIKIIRIYIQEIGIGFGMEKCAIFIIKSGKRQIMEEIEQLN